jgi:hypothetical protein
MAANTTKAKRRIILMATAEVELTPKVSRRRGKAKQDDLPTMEEHQKKIAEIEDLADVQLDLMDQMSSLKEKVKEADENLVASMKKHDRTFYARQSWGKVILKESRTHAKVTKAVVATDGDDEDSADE